MRELYYFRMLKTMVTLRNTLFFSQKVFLTLEWAIYLFLFQGTLRLDALESSHPISIQGTTYIKFLVHKLNARCPHRKLNNF